MRILLVDHDPEPAEVLRGALTRRGHAVAVVRRLAEVPGAPVGDLVLVDLTRAAVAGLEWCRTLRALHPPLGIIAMAARTGRMQAIACLTRGVDDFIVSPASVAEIVARVEAVLRRSVPVSAAGQRQEIGPFTVHPPERGVRANGVEATLTPREFEVFLSLAHGVGRAVARDDTIRAVWRSTWIDPHALEVHVAALRSKLAGIAVIDTIRGYGYRLSPVGVVTDAVA